MTTLCLFFARFLPPCLCSVVTQLPWKREATGILWFVRGRLLRQNFKSNFEFFSKWIVTQSAATEKEEQLLCSVRNKKESCRLLSETESERIEGTRKTKGNRDSGAGRETERERNAAIVSSWMRGKGGQSRTSDRKLSGGTTELDRGVLEEQEELEAINMLIRALPFIRNPTHLCYYRRRLCPVCKLTAATKTQTNPLSNHKLPINHSPYCTSGHTLLSFPFCFWSAQGAFWELVSGATYLQVSGAYRCAGYAWPDASRR